MTCTCRSCGAAVDSNVNYCPTCGALLTVDSNGNAYGSTQGSYSSSQGTNQTLKTAAIAGGTALGVSALAGLARNMTHRRRTPYMGGMMMGGGRPPMGPPPMGGGHGPGGPGRMM